MKKADMKQPVAMATAFANDVYTSSGSNDFEIPAFTSATDDDSCVIDDGFLPITSIALDNGGKAPERKNFNGLFYLSTDLRNYLQNGGVITYSDEVAEAIGGYPKDAVLANIADDKLSCVISLIDDNNFNFVTNPEYIDDIHWKKIGFDNFLNKTQITNCILEAPNGVATYTGNTITVKADLKVLLPNGLNSDGTLNNIEYALGKDVSTTLTGTNAPLVGYRYVFIDSNGIIRHFNTQNVFFTSGNAPVTGYSQARFNYDGNSWYYINANESNETAIKMVPIAILNWNGTSITSFSSIKPINILKQTDKSLITHWGAPSNRYVSLTVGASNSTYTAPGDGWIWLSLNSGTSSSYMYLINATSGIRVGNYIGSGITQQVILPVGRGDTFRITYGSGITQQDRQLIFYYLQGAN